MVWKLNGLINLSINQRSRCVRTIVVWKRDLPPPALGLGGRALRENHSGMLRAVVGGSWLVVGQEQKN